MPESFLLSARPQWLGHLGLFGVLYIYIHLRADARQPARGHHWWSSSSSSPPASSSSSSSLLLFVFSCLHLEIGQRQVI